MLDALARLDENPAQVEVEQSPAAAAEAAQLRSAVVQLGVQVARVGTNVNQIARALHQSPAEVPAGLAAQLEAVAELVQSARQLIAERVS